MPQASKLSGFFQRKALLRCLIAAIATPFLFSFIFSGVYLPLDGVPPLGIEVHAGNDEPTVWRVDPNSPAADAGMLSGDKIREFNGTRVRQLNDYLIPEQLIVPNSPARISVERDGHQLELVLEPRGSYFTSVTHLNKIAIIFWALLGILELILAATLAFGRPTNGSALAAALFLAALTTINSQSAGLTTAFRGLPFLIKLIIYPIPLLSLEILFFAFVFCACFPRPIFSRPLTWILSALPAAAIYLYLILLNVPLCFGSRPELLFKVGLGVYFESLKVPIVLVLSTYGLAAVAAIVINYRRCDTVERRRIRLMLAGAMIGLASVVPAAIIHDLIYSDLISRSGLISIAFGLLRIVFLVSLVYAVLKHRVFDIPVLLRRSGRYLLVQRGYLIVLTAGGIVITAVFARVLSRAFPAASVFSVPIGAAFGMALVWIGAMVHRRVQVRLDRAFFRSAYDAQQILEEMAEKSRRAITRSELAEVLRVHVYQALRPVRISILLETAHRQLTLFDDSGLQAVTMSADSPELLAITKSGRAVELEPKHWDSSKSDVLRTLQPECLVPIIGRAEGLRGLLALGPKLSEEPYSSEDLRLLQSAAAQAGVALENISLAEDIAERLQAEQVAARELEIARSVQSKLLPEAAPELASLHCVGRCLQARQVGGDFYDFLEYAPGKIGLVLADIAGKGISAALLMANLQAHLRSQRVESSGDIEATLSSVNRLFKKSIEIGSFATLFLGFYDDAVGVLTYANCGHAPPVVMRRDGRVHRLDATATVLGAFSDWQCGVEEVAIEPGDVLVLYSDGITEAENRDGEQFGEARLLELLHGCRDLSADQLLEAIIGSVLDFSDSEQLDDITLVIAQSKAVPKIMRQAASSTHLTQ
jgi:serine phosphatase RsbU (regulator of sigma subunit)